MGPDLSHWIPPSILSAAFVTLALFAWRLLSTKGTEMVDQIKEIRLELTAIDKKLGGFATTTALGSMGDRFDARFSSHLERISALEREIAVLKDKRGRRR